MVPEWSELGRDGPALKCHLTLRRRGKEEEEKLSFV